MLIEYFDFRFCCSSIFTIRSPSIVYDRRLHTATPQNVRPPRVPVSRTGRGPETVLVVRATRLRSTQKRFYSVKVPNDMKIIMKKKNKIFFGVYYIFSTLPYRQFPSHPRSSSRYATTLSYNPTSSGLTVFRRFTSTFVNALHVTIIIEMGTFVIFLISF